MTGPPYTFSVDYAIKSMEDRLSYLSDLLKYNEYDKSIAMMEKYKEEHGHSDDIEEINRELTMLYILSDSNRKLLLYEHATILSTLMKIKQL